MTFAQIHQLRPGDVVVVPQGIFNLVAHYVVYRGPDADGNDIYMENMNGFGVRYITGEQFIADNPVHKRIRKFTGTDFERQLAVERGDALIGSPYHLVNFNCEDYANHIQFNRAFSKQTKSVIMTVVGLIIAGTVTILSTGGRGRRRLRN